MAELDVVRLTERLLRGGVAPKHVRRTVAELRDHFEDLKEEARKNGCAGDEAAKEAQNRLGSEDVIANDILARPELQSWAARWPWAVYGLGPLFSFVVIALGSILLFGFGMGFGNAVTDARYIPPLWLQSVIDVFFLCVVYLAPLLVAVWVCRQAVLRRAAMGWPGIGFLMVCICGAALDIAVNWPATSEALAHLSVGFSLAPPFPDPSDTVLRALINVAVVAVFLRWCRHKQPQHYSSD